MSKLSERGLRLECLRIAANVVTQLKNDRLSLVELAEAYFKFVDAKEEGAEGGEDVLDEEPARVEPPQGRYSLRELRRGR